MAGGETVVSREVPLVPSEVRQRNKPKPTPKDPKPKPKPKPKPIVK